MASDLVRWGVACGGGAFGNAFGAQVQAQGFYEKFGFHTCGEPVYMDVHIPHVDMVRHLSGEA